MPKLRRYGPTDGPTMIDYRKASHLKDLFLEIIKIGHTATDLDISCLFCIFNYLLLYLCKLLFLFIIYFTHLA